MLSFESGCNTIAHFNDAAFAEFYFVTQCSLHFIVVSRHHARIEPREAGSYWIEDLSVNGTRLNAAMLEERTRLSPGDRIYVEDFVIIFQPDDLPSETLMRGETELV